MSDPTRHFNAWMHELRNLAARSDLTWILGDAASNRPAFNDGLTPTEALNALTAEVDESHV